MNEEIRVCMDVQRRTCLEVGRDLAKGQVLYLQFEPSQTFKVLRAPIKVFDTHFRPDLDYEPKRCAQLYLGYAAHLGATAEAVGYLKRLVRVHPTLEAALTRAVEVPHP